MSEQSKRFETGALFMTGSAIMLSLFTLFAKFGTSNFSFFLLIFLRFVVPFVLLVPFLIYKNSISHIFHVKNLKMQFLRIACILLYQYCIFYYLLKATLLNATVLQNTAPLFIPVLEWLFFKKPFKKKAMLIILISFAGVLCILQPTAEILGEMSIIGLLAPLGQAGSQVLYGHQSRNENQQSNLFYFFFLTSIVSGIIFLFSEEFVGEQISGNLSLFVYLNIIGLGIASIFNQSLRGVAYSYGSPSSLAPFLYLSLIFSGLLDWAIFHRLPNMLTVIGTLLVCLGGLIQIHHKRRVQ